MIKQVIIVDWGTTNFRAWLIDSENGEILESIDHGKGMSVLKRDEFPAYCSAQIAPWRAKNQTPVYMAGMVGADQGWHKAPQLPVPVNGDDIAANVVAAPGLSDAWIIPGARVPGEAPDVMRGEEVQIFGALALANRDEAVCCLPGTHSKWAKVQGKQLKRFHTVMTGEIYGLLLTHSILSRSLPESGLRAGLNEAAFLRGLEKSIDEGGLLNQLFSTRSLFLQGNLLPEDAADYISGILIGQEVASMGSAYPAEGCDLLLIGSDDLRARYRLALDRAEYSVCEYRASDASLAGMKAIIQRHQGQSDRM